MLNCFTTQKLAHAIPIVLINHRDYSKWLNKQNAYTKKWLASTGFLPNQGNIGLIPDQTGQISRVICCIDEEKYFWNLGSLPYSLPEGVYELDLKNESVFLQQSIAWGLGAYQFCQYKSPARKPAILLIKKSFQHPLESMVKSLYLVRDLINTPTDEMGPSELAEVVRLLSRKWKARFTQIKGKELQKGYPCIHTVGRASDDPPRLLDLRWGHKKHFKVTLVGKGVCFDTGGLDLKPSAAMLLMKKDMAGAAHILGLAQMIIAAKLPIQLRLLIPLVENSVSGNAYRPGDIIRSRNGKTIEVGNTDAEGRLILADALTRAVEESPDLLIDISTLTGAARVALGTELPAFFANQENIAEAVIRHANQEQDYIWRLPLFSLYRDALNSPIADLNNNPIDGYGGAITAALFLKEFVPDSIPWLHFDLMAWNLKNRAGRPAGGEAMALRALFSLLSEKCSI